MSCDRGFAFDVQWRFWWSMSVVDGLPYRLCEVPHPGPVFSRETGGFPQDAHGDPKKRRWDFSIPSIYDWILIVFMSFWFQEWRLCIPVWPLPWSEHFLPTVPSFWPMNWVARWWCNSLINDQPHLKHVGPTNFYVFLNDVFSRGHVWFWYEAAGPAVYRTWCPWCPDSSSGVFFGYTVTIMNLKYLWKWNTLAVFAVCTIIQ